MLRRILRSTAIVGAEHKRRTNRGRSRHSWRGDVRTRRPAGKVQHYRRPAYKTNRHSRKTVTPIQKQTGREWRGTVGGKWVDLPTYGRYVPGASTSSGGGRDQVQNPEVSGKHPNQPEWSHVSQLPPYARVRPCPQPFPSMEGLWTGPRVGYFPWTQEQMSPNHSPFVAIQPRFRPNPQLFPPGQVPVPQS